MARYFILTILIFFFLMIDLYKTYHNFIIENDHPCIMAQSVFITDEVELYSYQGLGTREAAEQLINDIKQYLHTYDFDSNSFKTLMAVFAEDKIDTEKEFEDKLWQHLSHLYELDDQPWDETVAMDPASSDFSFSIAGAAFFIVGMHPNSSRKARRSPHPCLTFNLHWQFQRLREMGTFEQVRDKIRERDKDLQGYLNPVVKDHGEESEAKQYSGRNVEDNWKCPFHPTIKK